MELSDKFKELAHTISEMKEFIVTEEDTKSSAVEPFLELLGYNVRDLRQVKKEFQSDFVKKIKRGRGECVDYALLGEGRHPFFFYEAKPMPDNLLKYDGQLSRYFNATVSVKFACLTNGSIYMFFSDFCNLNVMDREPFKTINIEDLCEGDIEFLERLHRDNFSIETFTEYAEQLALEHPILKQRLRIAREPKKPGRPLSIDNKRMTINCSKELCGALDYYAEVRGRRFNKSEWIRDILARELDKEGIFQSYREYLEERDRQMGVVK